MGQNNQMHLITELNAFDYFTELASDTGAMKKLLTFDI